MLLLKLFGVGAATFLSFVLVSKRSIRDVGEVAAPTLNPPLEPVVDETARNILSGNDLAIEIIESENIAPVMAILDDPVIVNTPPVQSGRSLPRGIRNNNGGNIEAGQPWQGAIGDDGRFIIFSSPEFGIRALGKLLLNYQSIHGLNTVRGIINRYAPSFENDTSSYARAVSHALGLTPDTPFQVRDKLIPLVAAIIKHENGQQPYSQTQLQNGINLI